MDRDNRRCSNFDPPASIVVFLGGTTIILVATYISFLGLAGNAITSLLPT